MASTDEKPRPASSSTLEGGTSSFLRLQQEHRQEETTIMTSERKCGAYLFGRAEKDTPASGAGTPSVQRMDVRKAGDNRFRP